METLLAWWPAVATAVNLLVLWVAWSLRQIAAERLQAQSNRITRIEEKLQHVPAASELGAMRENFERLHGDLRALGATIEGVSRTLDAQSQAVNRIHEHLLSRSA